MNRLLNSLRGVGVVLLVVLFCGPVMAAQGKVLMMATTTSTDNTGLLDYLAPEFTKDTGISLRWTAVGTGKALKLGQNCDVDMLMVHAPAAERMYVANGYGIKRRQVMYNDFVIIGPAADPAGIKGKKVTPALKNIAAKSIQFISRGDNSGTNKKEISLWKSTDLPLPDKERWYVQTGQGMLASINIAAQKGGYIMTDRGTFIKYSHNHGGKPPLVVIVEGDSILVNQYSVLQVNPSRCKQAQAGLAQAFSDWISGARAQKLIADFRLLGQQLFTPNAE